MNAIQGRFTKLPIDNLILDPTNPRVARYLQMYRGQITDNEMGLALSAGSSEDSQGGTTFHSLRASIKTHGTVIQPILVNNKVEDGLVIIEGNTRAFIYREFKKNDDSGTWDDIPAIVYDNLDETDIDAIRLQAHLVGPRQWDAYSKAKYLDYLSNSRHLTTDQIIDFCGGQSTDVRRKIDAYQDMERNYRPLLDSDDQFDPSRFSAFDELQSPRIKEALTTAQYTTKDFARWVRDGLLYPNSLVRRLPAILADPKAKEVFLKDGAREAEKVLVSPSTFEALEDATLEQLANALVSRIEKMRYQNLRDLRNNLSSDENFALTQARDELTQLCADIASPNSNA